MSYRKEPQLRSPHPMPRGQKNLFNRPIVRKPSNDNAVWSPTESGQIIARWKAHWKKSFTNQQGMILDDDCVSVLVPRSVTNDPDAIAKNPVAQQAAQFLIVDDPVMTITYDGYLALEKAQKKYDYVGIPVRGSTVPVYISIVTLLVAFETLGRSSGLRFFTKDENSPVCVANADGEVVMIVALPQDSKFSNVLSVDWNNL